MTAPERRIAVLGAGPTGVTVGAGLACLGHRVVLRSDPATALDSEEPRLLELVRHTVLTGRLRFAAGNVDAVREVDTVFCCDLSRYELEELGRTVPQGRVVVSASASSWDSTEEIRRCVRAGVRVVSNPLFLTAGSAVADFLTPERVVIGSDGDEAGEHVASLYRSLQAAIVRTDVHTAELIRHAVNGYFAVKQRYLNALAGLCTEVGADIDGVAQALAYDDRIGGCHTTPAPLWSDLQHSLEVLSRAAGPEQELLHNAAALADCDDRDGSDDPAAGARRGRPCARAPGQPD